MTPLVLWGAGAEKKAEPGKGFGGFPVLEGKEVPEVINNITNSINIIINITVIIILTR